jgi:hypothetical protein
MNTLTDTRPWSQTFSGRAFPMIEPSPEDVHWPDVIYGLSHINRFCGHVGTYSVAQHSVLVADQLPDEWRLYGLLHDAHEAYIGDISTPVKRALNKGRTHTDLTDLADGVDRAIYLAAGLTYPVPETIAEAVYIADTTALMTERRDLMREPPKSWGGYERTKPLPEHIIRWTPQQSIARYAMALGDSGIPIATLSFVS